MTKQEQSAYWNKALSEMPEQQLETLYKYFCGLPFNKDVGEILGYFFVEFQNRPEVLNKIVEELKQ